LYDVIIIGGGIAGFSAAIYAGRLKLQTLLLAKMRGGTIVLTNEISNWPGIKMTDGMSLAKQIEEHALEYGIEVKDAEVIKIEKAFAGFKVKSFDKMSYDAKTLVIATGGEHRKLGIPGEKEFSGKGVHSCALCDGYFYKDKIVAVVGGSDSAAKEALLLTQWAKKVYIIYRKEKIRAEPLNYEKVQSAVKMAKMEVITNRNLIRIEGERRVSRVILDKDYNGAKEVQVDAVFVEAGRIPNSEIAKQIGVKTNNKGEIIIDKNATTNIAGVFAAGDVVDTTFKQAITASAGGVIAAYSAYEYLKSCDR
jgi:thioredoxin reductase (NADPH)